MRRWAGAASSSLRPGTARSWPFSARTGDQHILVVANLSGSVEYVELDLAEYKGVVPVEVFGHTRFPPDRRAALSPHPRPAFLLLVPPPPRRVPHHRGPVHAGRHSGVAGQRRLGAGLPGRNAQRAGGPPPPLSPPEPPWFAGSGRTIDHARFVDVIPLEAPGLECVLTLVEVDYAEGGPGDLLHAHPVPVDPRAGGRRRCRPEGELAEVVVEGRNGPGGFLREAFTDAAVAEALFDAITRRRTLRGTAGEVIAVTQGRVFRQLQNGPGQHAAAPARRPEQATVRWSSAPGSSSG